MNASILWIWSEHRINNKEVMGASGFYSSSLVGLLFPFLVWLQVKEFSGFIIVVKPMSSFFLNVLTTSSSFTLNILPKAQILFHLRSSSQLFYSHNCLPLYTHLSLLSASNFAIFTYIGKWSVIKSPLYTVWKPQSSHVLWPQELDIILYCPCWLVTQVVIGLCF